MATDERFKLKEEDEETLEIDYGMRELLFLCYNGNFRTLELLVKSNSQLLTKRVKGAIGDCPKVEHDETWTKIDDLLLKTHEFTVGNILLCVACMLKDLQTAQFLVNKGIDVNILTSIDETLSPLFIACKNEDISMANFLCKHNAEITSFITDRYPEIIFQILQKHVTKHKLVKVKGPKKTLSTKKTFKLSWEHLRLHAIKINWLQVHEYEIARVELARNKLAKLPEEFFTLLPHLEEVDVSSNMLDELPFFGLAESKLKHLDVSSNQLQCVPPAMFMNNSIKTINICNNKIENLPNVSKKWKCVSLEKLNCSRNLLSELPKSINGASNLQKLMLMFNEFKDFDRSWKCPLKELNLSRNKLEDFTCKSDSVWSKTLQRVNLSYNKLTKVPLPVIHLTKLEDLKLSHNKLQTLPRLNEWKVKQLIDLDLSHNQLSSALLNDGFLDIETESLEFNYSCELPVKMLADTLQTLNLSNNLLDHIPESLSQLKSLGYLDLSNNPNLTELPPCLGKLKNIWSLNLSGLEIRNVPYELDAKGNLASFEDYKWLIYHNFQKTGINHVQVLSFLRAQLRQSKPFNRIKLMLVGLQGRGKTTLVNAIQGKPIPPNLSTVGISIDQFVLPLRYSYIAEMFWYSQPEIVFSAWDLAGQQVYYATHQCFLTGKTLYLVVFNVTHGNEGIDALGPWLLNIQARAPNSRCIIVGTHVDLMPTIRKEETLIKFTSNIKKKFCKVGFPMITVCIYVSSTTQENIEKLREVIYSEAEMMLKGSTTGKIAPISYLELSSIIMEEAILCKEQNRPPVLTTEEMLELADRSPNNDILDFEELCSAAAFLHENGLMLHFNDHLRGLNNLFFIDPSWLIDIVSLVVTVRQRNPYVRNGYINENELRNILRNPMLPDDFIPQYLRLLERFEILLSLEDGRFLIPCMLPSEKPNIKEKMLHLIMSQDIRNMNTKNEREFNYLTRDYHMDYIPAGFWARLIARLVIAVQKWSLQIPSNDDGDYIGYTTHLWCDGLMVTYEDGYFLVEAFHDEELRPKKWSNRGVAITVWSQAKDFSVMGFIVDHLEMLITEWYPGLEGINEMGYNLVQKLISCPVCSAEKANDIVKCCDKKINDLRNHYSSFFRNEFFVNQFSLDLCAYAAIYHKSIICKSHPGQPVPLHLLIPEIMMTDLPQNFRINHEELDFDPSTSKVLGDGGAGIVYLGRYGDIDVAIKRSHTVIMKKDDIKDESDNDAFDPSSRNFDGDTSLIVKTFWDIRQEVLVLCTLNHPNIINFLGVCFKPLSFVIEFAPMGSLFSIIEDKAQQNKGLLKPVWPVLGIKMTFLVAFQIIEAIRYLHEWGIIYRDLKSDNVLVMSLDENETINVKLSDYGIAAFATPQGVAGDVGTPGFQAPEVQKDNTYDEKVDIFSYGSWLYELISGSLPYLEYKSSSDIKKAIAQGVRPSFEKEGIKIDYKYMDILMNNCWQHEPSARLSASNISNLFNTPDLCLISHIYPSKQDSQYIDHVTCFCTWNTEFPDRSGSSLRDKLLLWNNKNEERTYIILDLKCPTIRWKDSLPGPRVSCACQVEGNIWLGCETKKEIQVFGFLNSEFPRILWTFSGFDDDILMIVKHEDGNKLSIFASLANGTVVVFNKLPQQEEQVVKNSEDCWNQQVINLNTEHRPAKCMSVTNSGKELWVGSGNLIAIFDIDTNEIVDHLTANNSSEKHSLVSLMCSDGVNKVWTCFWKTGYVVQWDVETRSKTFEYSCSEKNPLNEMVRYESGSIAGLMVVKSLSSEDGETEEDGSPSRRLLNMIGEDNVFAENSIYKRPSLRFPSRAYVRHKSVHRHLSQTSWCEISEQDVDPQNYVHNITSLIHTPNLLWIGRSSGDMLIIDYVTGHVISVLGDDRQKLLGGDTRQLHSMIQIGSDKMAACVRKKERVKGSSLRSSIPHKKFLEVHQILVCNVWSSEELWRFNKRIRATVMG